VDEEASPVKKRWTLIAVVAVLALVVGGYFALKLRPRPAARPSESAGVELNRVDAAKLAKITLTRPGGTLVAEQAGGAWKVNYPYPVTLDKGNVDDLVSTFADLTAERLIEQSPADLAPFGLAPPKAVASIVMTDGTEKTFLLGDKTPSGTGYYLQVKGTPAVYSVWLNQGDRFRWTLSDLRDRKLGPEMKPDDVASVTMRVRSGAVIEFRAKSEAESRTFQLGFGKYLMTRPYPYPVGVDTQKVQPLLEAAVGQSVADFVDDSPKSLSPYGLDRPWGELTVKTAQASLALSFGAADGPDKVYARLQGKPGVFAVARSGVEFLSSKPFDLIDRFAFIPNIEDVDRLEIAAGGKTHVLTLARTVKKAEKAGEEDETLTAYTADGKSVEEGSFKKFYQSLIGLSVEGEVSRPVAGAADVTTRYFLNKGEPRQVTVSYVAYDRDFFAVLVNGKGSFALSRLQVEKMLSRLDTLARGETVGD
jgi:hypothetical protein